MGQDERVVDAQQRYRWLAAHRALDDELSGRVRRRRSWRTWGPGALPAIVLVALLVGDVMWFHPTVDTEPYAPFWLRTGLILVGLVLTMVGAVLAARSGMLWGSRCTPTAPLSDDQERRCLRLVAGVDRTDPSQIEAASDLARRVSLQRSRSLFNACFVLLMLALLLAGGDPLSMACALLVLLAHLVLAVLRERRVHAARRFLTTLGRAAPFVAA